MGDLRRRNPEEVATGVRRVEHGRHPRTAGLVGAPEHHVHVVLDDARTMSATSVPVTAPSPWWADRLSSWPVSCLVERCVAQGCTLTQRVHDQPAHPEGMGPRSAARHRQGAPGTSVACAWASPITSAPLRSRRQPTTGRGPQADRADRTGHGERTNPSRRQASRRRHCGAGRAVFERRRCERRQLRWTNSQPHCPNRSSRCRCEPGHWTSPRTSPSNVAPYESHADSIMYRQVLAELDVSTRLGCPPLRRQERRGPSGQHPG